MTNIQTDQENEENHRISSSLTIKKGWADKVRSYKGVRILESIADGFMDSLPFTGTVAILGFCFYVALDLEKQEIKHHENATHEVLATLDSDRNLIITREEIREHYAEISMKYNPQILNKIYRKNKEKFEDSGGLDAK